MNTFSIQDKKIGIIGFGKFGKLISQSFFPNNTIYIYTPHTQDKKFPLTSVVCDTIAEVVKQTDIIIPTVPIHTFENVIKKIAPHVHENQIVMDVCSVKVYPVTVMQKNLPKKTQIMATHPMFGPVSVHMNANTVKNLRFVMKNITAQQATYLLYQNYFRELGLQIIELTPQEHDVLAARSHFFSKIVKYVSDTLHLQKTILDTPTADKIFEALTYTADDVAILQDMITYNTYCKELLDNLVISLKTLQIHRL